MIRLDGRGRTDLRGRTLPVLALGTHIFTSNKFRIVESRYPISDARRRERNPEFVLVRFMNYSNEMKPYQFQHVTTAMDGMERTTRSRGGLAAILLIGLALTGCENAGLSGMETESASHDGLTSAARSADVIPGRFIVTVRPGEDASTVAREHGVQPEFSYRHALNGFAGSISEAARGGIMRDARVLRVEPDQVVQVRPITAAATQTENLDRAWGLDRVDARSGIDGSYSYTRTGAGVKVYVLDTGIRYSHTEFGSRAKFGFDAFGGDGTDCNNHGTHVAGTIGGVSYGVAKNVELVAVRVLNCSGSGTLSGVIAGVDWVTEQAGKGPAVANMSLGGGASASLDAAVAASIAAGIPYAVAAGNGNMGGREQDACNYSPARVPAAMTIGATDKADKKASFSNFGSCVDWFAPGVGIGSSTASSDASWASYSGTSMATPHVAGVAALFLEKNPNASPAAVRDGLYVLATKGIVSASKTSDNHLLYSMVDGAEDTPPGDGGGDGGDGGDDNGECIPVGKSGKCR